MNIHAIYNYELVTVSREVVDDEIERIIDAAAEELQNLRFADAVISGSIVNRKFEIFIPASGDTFADIAQKVDSGIRSAFHTAGVHTPGWPEVDDFPVRLERREITFKEPDPDGELAGV